MCQVPWVLWVSLPQRPSRKLAVASCEAVFNLIIQETALEAARVQEQADAEKAIQALDGLDWRSRMLSIDCIHSLWTSSDDMQCEVGFFLRGPAEVGASGGRPAAVCTWDPSLLWQATSFCMEFIAVPNLYKLHFSPGKCIYKRCKNTFVPKLSILRRQVYPSGSCVKRQCQRTVTENGVKCECEVNVSMWMFKSVRAVSKPCEGGISPCAALGSSSRMGVFLDPNEIPWTRDQSWSWNLWHVLETVQWPANNIRHICQFILWLQGFQALALALWPVKASLKLINGWSNRVFSSRCCSSTSLPQCRGSEPEDVFFFWDLIYASTLSSLNAILEL